MTVLLTACGTTLPPLRTVDHVDIQSFMGDCYVVARIPTPYETEANNAVESCRLDEDGTIATAVTFHKGAFDGPLKPHEPRGSISKLIKVPRRRPQP
ncbi:MAG: hypothetical protein EG828_14340 [Deltaproteobacteria bacterium]|nr:hypothetical protein [Deltaproteobacteria bacterium]